MNHYKRIQARLYSIRRKIKCVSAEIPTKYNETQKDFIIVMEALDRIQKYMEENYRPASMSVKEWEERKKI